MTKQDEISPEDEINAIIEEKDDFFGGYTEQVSTQKITIIDDFKKVIQNPTTNDYMRLSVEYMENLIAMANIKSELSLYKFNLKNDIRKLEIRLKEEDPKMTVKSLENASGIEFYTQEQTLKEYETRFNELSATCEGMKTVLKSIDTDLYVSNKADKVSENVL